MHKFAISILVGTSLTACSAANDPSGQAGQTSMEAPLSVSTVAPDLVRLSGEGFTITGPLGSELAFGTDREVVEQALARVLGDPSGRSTNDECGAGPVEFSSFIGGLTLNFQNDKLAGWTLQRDEDDAPIATAEGIAVGLPYDDLTAVYSVEQVADSTLGDEFYTDENIGGFTTDSGNGLIVESLYAGTTCFFR